jgi:hypothetical protein
MGEILIVNAESVRAARQKLVGGCKRDEVIADIKSMIEIMQYCYFVVTRNRYYGKSFECSG